MIPLSFVLIVPVKNGILFPYSMLYIAVNRKILIIFRHKDKNYRFKLYISLYIIGRYITKKFGYITNKFNRQTIERSKTSSKTMKFNWNSYWFKITILNWDSQLKSLQQNLKQITSIWKPNLSKSNIWFFFLRNRPALLEQYSIYFCWNCNTKQAVILIFEELFLASNLNTKTITIANCTYCLL